MADTGWVYPSAYGEVQNGGTRDWRNEGNIVSDNGAYADGNGYIYAYNLLYMLYGGTFDLGIPSGATIDGIEVQVQAQSASVNEARDETVQLFKAGAVGGADRSADTGFTSSGWETRTYGGPTDLWGRTWAPADLNNTLNFRVGFQARQNDGWDSTGAIRVDFIRVKVYYTAGGTTHEAAMALGIQAGASAASAATLGSVVAFGLSAGLSALTAADMEAAADLAVQAGLAPSATAAMAPAAVLAMAAGVSPSAAADLLAGVAVAVDLGMAFSAGATVQEADLSFGVAAGLAPSVVADLLSDVALGADLAVAVDAGAAVREAALAIGLQAGFSPSATAVLAGTVTLTATIGLSAVTLAEFETAVVLDADFAAAVQAGQDQEAAVAFGAALGAAVAATVAAGGIEAPARRTHRVEARGRTLHVTVRNRNRTV